jgi:hypothetical protein
MRVGLLALLFLVWSASAPAQTEKATDNASESERAGAAAKLARAAAEGYAFTLEGASGTPLTLDPKPLLQWSNPVVGSIHGSVFVWNGNGRPEMLASIYKWYGPKHFHLGVEFHSLAEAPVSARNDGAVVWSPRKAGITFAPVPGAPAVADTPEKRLRQMRALAKEFTATEVDREAQTRDLRLLTQPVYRYGGPGGPTDGGLFAFVIGTDPELILLLEARRGAGGAPVWHYAAARMNSCTLRLTHKGRALWSQPEWPWAVVFAHSEPYTVFMFDPGQGVVPAGR